MKIINITPKLKKILIGLFIATLIFQCKDPELVVSTSDAVNITGYLEKNPQEFSEFLKMLELTSNSGFLNAYGSYTCFTPTNEAIQKFLESKGKSSLEEMDVEELKRIVKFHLIQDTLSTATFTDGKISRLTMYGQYLITGAVNEGGVSYVRVNRQANIIKGNVVVQNGMMHIINGVLEPATYTVAQLVEQNPNFSIFTQALIETGFYDSLNTLYVEGSSTERKWLTLIAQSDQVFSEMGINSYEDLKTRYSTKNDPKDRLDSLHLFIGYHILRDSKYVADLARGSSHPTVLPLEVITTKLKGQAVLINEDVFNGVVEPGVEMDRQNSDYSATNGVLHSSLKNFAIKIRKPISIYWDVAEQPELMVKAVFRTPLGGSLDIAPGSLNDIKWGNSATNTIRYSAGVRNGAGALWVNYDVLSFSNSAARLGNNNINWVEFTTPLIPKGKYKFWICSTDINYNDIQFSFNGEVLPRIMAGRNKPSNTAIFWPSTNNVLLSEGDAEAQGFKYFSSLPPKPSGGNRTYFARLIGTIDVKTTDRHKLKFSFVTNDVLTVNGFNLDMIQIIPIENDQIWPKFTREGTQVQKP